MSIRAVLGCLYGDEAKAKIVDVLAAETDIVIRFQGGSNAGHTIVFGGQKFVMHLIPSGIFHPNQICVLASGVVIDPKQLEAEIEALSERNICFENRFFIDERATIVLPLHKVLDEKTESLQGDNKIGTTRRGIGPCYADSISRIAVKMFDLFDRHKLSDKIRFIYKSHNIVIAADDLSAQVEYLLSWGQRMKPHFVNLPYLMDSWIKAGKNILFEGAQGTLLDIYFGTYPFVTSSHTIAGGIATSIGFSPKKIDEIIGVYKSYVTRVGSGPFPTELFGEIGEKIRKQGNEYGSTTGRPRRCGWFDVVAAKYSAMINGVDSIALTLLDVLSGLDTIKICVGYKTSEDRHQTSEDRHQLTEFPADATILEKVSPVYIEMEGWSEDISQCKDFADLPVNAQNYVNKIQELMGMPVTIISVGADRKQTIRGKGLRVKG